MNALPTNNKTQTAVQALVRAHVNWREVTLFGLLTYGLDVLLHTSLEACLEPLWANKGVVCSVRYR